jgi:hypothetical protein
MQIKQGESRKVSGAHLEGICREARILAGDVMSVARSEILHSNRLSDLSIECVEDLRARRLLIDVAECVEVPIVVIPKSSWGVGAARRLLFQHALGLIRGRVINPRTRLQ